MPNSLSVLLYQQASPDPLFAKPLQNARFTVIRVLCKIAAQHIRSGGLFNEACAQTRFCGARTRSDFGIWPCPMDQRCLMPRPPLRVDPFTRDLSFPILRHCFKTRDNKKSTTRGPRGKRAQSIVPKRRSRGGHGDADTCFPSLQPL